MNYGVETIKSGRLGLRAAAWLLQIRARVRGLELWPRLNVGRSL